MYFYTALGHKKRVKYIKKYRIDWTKKSRSNFQKQVKNIMHRYWETHVMFEEFPVVGSRLSLDFYNATLNIAIEVQGRQHTEYVPFFHGKSKLNYLKQLKRDQEKYDFCEKNKIQLIEIHDENDVDFFREFLEGNREYE